MRFVRCNQFFAFGESPCHYIKRVKYREAEKAKNGCRRNMGVGLLRVLDNRHGKAGKRISQEQAAGIAHEKFGGMCIIPQKAQDDPQQNHIEAEQVKVLCFIA